MKMPNSNEPIQRASSTCVPSASTALATRIRNTLPAISCASLESLLSARVALMRANRPAAAERGADITDGTGSVNSGSGRDASDGKAISVFWQGIVKNRLDGVVCAMKSGSFELRQRRQDLLDRLALFGAERGLWRHRIAD